jgi:low temperature requirement protein LtrA
MLLVLPLGWVWIGVTYYNERFETAGFENRLATFALMVPVIGLAANADHALDTTFEDFALSYAVARVIITLLWLRATVQVPPFRPTGVRFVLGFTLSIVLVLAARNLPPPTRFGVFGVALLIDAVTPLFTLKQQRSLPRFSTSKLPERCGLFVIIVLGETVVAVVRALADLETRGIKLFFQAAAGVAIGFGLWWIYFDYVGRRSPRPSTGWGFLWGYGHLPLVMSIVAVGAGIQHTLASEGVMSADGRHLIAGALGIALLVTAILEHSTSRTPLEPAHPVVSPLLKVATGLVALLLAFTFPLDRPGTLLAALIGLQLVNMVYGLWVWYTQELPEGHRDKGHAS